MKAGYWFVIPWEVEAIGGVNNVVLNLNKQLIQNGLNTSIFISSWKDAVFRENNQNGLELRYGRLRNPLDGIKGSLMYWLTLPIALLRLAKILREENVVCINPHFPSASTLTFILLKKLHGFQGKVLVSFHGADITIIESTTCLERLIWHFILRNSDGLVACSHSLANRISAIFPDLSASVKVIHNGLDPLAFEAEQDQEACLPTELVGADFVLNVGTYEHKKGQDVLLEAFRELSGSRPNLKLVLIGRRTPILDELQQAAENMGIKDRTVFVEDLPHSKIVPFFKAATMFALPSRKEPFGIVVLEAGAFGLPVVASRVGGLPEILTSPDLGILVDPDDPSALASAMLKFLNEPEWARGIGENLRRHVHCNFSWQRAADSYLELLSPDTDKEAELT